jgi:hypothetical protein
LSIGERRAAHKNLTVVQFTGTLPASPPLFLPLRLNNARLDERLVCKLSILLRGYPGRVRLYLPRLRTSGDIKQLLDGGKITEDDGAFAEWAQQHLRMIEKNLTSGRPFDTEWSKQRMIDIRDVIKSGIVIEAVGRDVLGLDRIDMEPDEHQTVILRFANSLSDSRRNRAPIPAGSSTV